MISTASFTSANLPSTADASILTRGWASHSTTRFCACTRYGAVVDAKNIATVRHRQLDPETNANLTIRCAPRSDRQPGRLNTKDISRMDLIVDIGLLCEDSLTPKQRKQSNVELTGREAL